LEEGKAFGKLLRCKTTGQITRWLPLVDHCTDVAICFGRLCRCNAIRRALEFASGRALYVEDIERLSIIIFLHDIGKASSSFQSKRWQGGERPIFWPFPSGHGAQAIYLLQNDDALARLVDALPIDEMISWGEDGLIPLLFASISHHGRPLLEESEAVLRVGRKDWSAVKDANGHIHYDPLPVIEELTQRAKALFPNAFGEVHQALPAAPEFAHLVAGVIQFADWLGSDTRHFPIRIEEDRAKSAVTYAEAAVTTLGMETDHWRNSLVNSQSTFQHVFKVPAPHPIQAEMAEELGPLIILESETGSGKTEAALWRFVHLFRTGQVDSLYFALPTRVSAKQVYDRVRKAVKRLWPENPPLTVRALPGYAAADGEEPIMLPDFEVQWNDNPDDDKAMQRWAAEAPKRFLAAPIAVGTVDQALLGILKVKHAHMRFALLSRSLLVVDEVHASDAYMTVLLEKLLYAHLGNGGHALLLSATLGSSARCRYLAPGRSTVQPPPFDEAAVAAYPAISDQNGLHPMAATGRSKTVSWSLHDCIDNPEAIADLVTQAARDGAKVLVVRNTVGAAMELFRVIENRPEATDLLFHVNGLATLHHSRFSRQDRPLLDAAIETELGKQRPPGPRILIGTQTLEQSLDIDADLLITDLCPMDVLLQRIGRLHRHRRDASERPPAYSDPKALVLTPPSHDLKPLLKRAAYGLGRFSEGGGIYPDLRIVEATRRLIADQPVINIPADNRRLVEGATHPDRLAEIEESMGEEWSRHGQEVAGDTGANRTVANLHVLEIDKEFAGDPNMAFPTDQKIGSRLGAEDWLIHFETSPAGPFGEPLKQIPIRSHLLPEGLAPEALPERIETHDGVTEFNLGAARFRYSRLGLERLNTE
jgi:CRISPR-associated endonuclease/helicase Cas3